MLVEELKRKFTQLKKEAVSEDIIMNSFKESIHYYILHFIYTSKQYSNLVMYGGSVLRIGYGLNRMSEDLDFQTAKKVNIEDFKKDLIKYFKSNYNLDVEVSSGNPDKETLLFKIKFDILRNFSFQSKQWQKLKIRVDINYFPQTENFIKNTISRDDNNLIYTIRTYSLSTLMASKTVAFLSRIKRGIGLKDTNVKPRDVWDMMWYLDRKTMPDLEYLKTRGYNFKNFFDYKGEVIKRVNEIQDNIFKDDLAQFFLEPNFFQSWLSNWRVKFFQLLESYDVYEIGDLDVIYFSTEFYTENRLIVYKLKTDKNNSSRITFSVVITDSWFSSKDFQISSNYRDKEIESKIKITSDRKKLTDVELEYIGLFYRKIIDFLKRSQNIVYQESFSTKKIRTTADDLNIEKEIYLDRLLLEKIKFEELT